MISFSFCYVFSNINFVEFFLSAVIHDPHRDPSRGRKQLVFTTDPQLPSISLSFDGSFTHRYCS